MRTGFLSDATKILIFAATVIITCILVFLGFQAADIARDISESAVTQMTELNNDIKDGDIKMLDGSELQGSEVINFIKQQLGDYITGETAPIYVYVKTSASENTYTNDVYLTNITNFTDTHYIKPTAVFVGDVVKNDNKVILGVTFIQK